MFSYFMYFMGIIIAVMLILMRVDAVSTSYVSDMAVSFVDECRTTGKFLLIITRKHTNTSAVPDHMMFPYLMILPWRFLQTPVMS